MDRLEQLRDIYSKYVEETQKIYREAKPTDGLFGLGDDPRKHPCHMAFYEAAQGWTEVFLTSEPAQQEVFAVVRFILEAPAIHREQSCFWFLYAAQGLARPMIPHLTGEQCGLLRQAYDEAYPRRDRMPVQKEVYRLLKKGTGRR